MINSISGVFTVASPLQILIDTHGGVEYVASCPISVSERLSNPLFASGRIYIEPIYKEDAQELYAFLTIEDRGLFRHLISVSGVGGKTAISLMSKLDACVLVSAIINADTKALTAVKGIGEKTAKQLSIDLCDKLKKLYRPSENDEPQKITYNTEVKSDAVGALIALGYKSAEAEKMALGALGENPAGDATAIVKIALRK